MTAMIKVEHLKKSFGKKEVLKDISANVDKGKNKFIRFAEDKSFINPIESNS